MRTMALQRASELYGDSSTPWFRSLFQRVQRMPGASRLFDRITSAPDKEQFDDYFAEVVYALVFAGLGFQVEIEPVGRKGPDLRVSRDGQRAVVEVARFRDIYPGPPEFETNDDGNLEMELSEYGNYHRDIRKSFEKLLGKFSQVSDNQSIIAIWNDDGDLQEFHVQRAVAHLRADAARHILAIPNALLFVIYGSRWVRARDARQLFCFPVCSPERCHQLVWQQDLGGSTVRNLIERAALCPDWGRSQ